MFCSLIMEGADVVMNSKFSTESTWLFTSWMETAQGTSNCYQPCLSFGQKYLQQSTVLSCPWGDTFTLILIWLIHIGFCSSSDLPPGGTPFVVTFISHVCFVPKKNYLLITIHRCTGRFRWFFWGATKRSGGKAAEQCVHQQIV